MDFMRLLSFKVLLYCTITSTVLIVQWNIGNDRISSYLVSLMFYYLNMVATRVVPVLNWWDWAILGVNWVHTKKIVLKLMQLLIRLLLLNINLLQNEKDILPLMHTCINGYFIKDLDLFHCCQLKSKLILKGCVLSINF